MSWKIYMRHWACAHVKKSWLFRQRQLIHSGVMGGWLWDSEPHCQTIFLLAGLSSCHCTVLNQNCEVDFHQIRQISACRAEATILRRGGQDQVLSQADPRINNLIGFDLTRLKPMYVVRDKIFDGTNFIPWYCSVSYSLSLYGWSSVITYPSPPTRL